ncbi:DUF2599 domain-containing protein [Pseudomonas sp.]|uniref:DUF2599 domain-containing protein n=1 Tax=Pseudomonas sp. TaxID=306 RepID=UPI00262FBA7F|nr:DUF2599 domain-containing protein [Pseudomonas sp.]
MTHKILLSFLFISAHSSAVEFILPPDQTVDLINKNYNERVYECKERASGLIRGHYYCSGVIVRSIDTGRFPPWDYSPSAVKLGSTSFSWIRSDIPTNKLYHPAGLIVRSPEDAANNNLPILDQGWECIYTTDANTTRGILYPNAGKPRGWNGCDFEGDFNEDKNKNSQTVDNDNDANAYGSCREIGVGSDDLKQNQAQLWLNRYNGDKQRTENQCSWNVEKSRDWNSMIDIRTSAAFKNVTIWTEMLLKNTPGANDGSRLIPYIDAFFYDVNNTTELNEDKQNSVTVARIFQAQLKRAGYAVPILRLNFNAAPAQRFTYSPADQGTCSSYIKSATWRLNNESKKWTLSVVPTDCGRLIKAEETDVAYSELAFAHDHDAQWLENNGGGMRRQFVCLTVNYRDKEQWNLEPFRPDVSQDVATKAHCNP